MVIPRVRVIATIYISVLIVCQQSQLSLIQIRLLSYFYLSLLHLSNQQVLWRQRKKAKSSTPLGNLKLRILIDRQSNCSKMSIRTQSTTHKWGFQLVKPVIPADLSLHIQNIWSLPRITGSRDFTGTPDISESYWFVPPFLAEDKKPP